MHQDAETLEQLTERYLLIGRCITYMQVQLRVYMTDNNKVEIFDTLEALDIGSLIHLYATKSFSTIFRIEPIQSTNNIEDDDH